ncbi:MAG: general stress protein CsbD [Bacteroidetes bacterium]|nr:general stress protein CsbD [Bacteroidota bacterium]HET6245093.1 general stress protein CsbD [Bacteroidia bacterium]
MCDSSDENWDQIKKILKQKLNNLTNSKLLLEEGKREEILKRLQKKFGKSKEEIQKLISDL